MFFKTADGTEKKVMFRHNRENRPDKEGVQRAHPFQTECSIFDVNDANTVLGTGLAQCHTIDHFNKTVGRKLSFQRALENAGFNKVNRAFGWAEFWG